MKYSFFIFMLFIRIKAMQERESRWLDVIKKYDLEARYDSPTMVTDDTLIKWASDLRDSFGLSEQELCVVESETNFIVAHGLLCKAEREEYLLQEIVEQESELDRVDTNEQYAEILDIITKAKQANSGCYKIHAMPGSVHAYREILRTIIYCLANDSKFQDSLQSFKMQPFIDFSLKQEEISEILEAKSETGGLMPIIVIYPGNGKEAAQYILDILYEQCKGIKGLGLAPRFSKEASEDFLFFYTLGNGDEKGRFGEFFTKNKVFYNKNFIKTAKKSDFKLKIPGKKS